VKDDLEENEANILLHKVSKHSKRCAKGKTRDPFVVEILRVHRTRLASCCSGECRSTVWRPLRILFEGGPVWMQATACIIFF
jgi:hypothetical protein